MTEIVGGSLDPTGFCDEMRRLIDMIERGDVGIGGFKMNLGYDGELELQVSIIGVGAKTETMRSINGTMLPVTTRGPAPGAQELINGLIQATQGGARANPLAATAAQQRPLPSRYPNLSERQRQIKQRALQWQRGGPPADYVALDKYGQPEPVFEGSYDLPSPSDPVGYSEREEQELIGAPARPEPPARPKPPEGTRDLDLDI